MRKILLFISLVLVFAVGCTTFDEPSAAPDALMPEGRYLSNSEACDVASKAFEDFFKETPVSRSSRTAFATLYRNTRSRVGEDTMFYIVNFNEGGFAVIVAERNATTQILAISDKGSFTEDGNECLQEYMDITSDLRPWVRDTTKWTPDTMPSDLIKIDTVIIYHDRFLPTIWGQDSPYNKFCPILNNGRNAPAGCTPVAMAQVLAYHRRPESINGYPLYWMDMLTSPEIYYLSPTGKDYVARLIRECGSLLETIYDTNSFTITDFFIIPAFKSLGYNNAEYHQDLSKCINSIKTDGPVLMWGTGHAWVAQGAKILVRKFEMPFEDDIQYYLHMNWGWNGCGDGYYLVKPGYDDNEIMGFKNFNYVTGVN